MYGYEMEAPVVLDPAGRLCACDFPDGFVDCIGGFGLMDSSAVLSRSTKMTRS